MKQPNYLVFGLAWIMMGLASILFYVRDFPEVNPRHLVRAGLFFLMGLFYFYMNRKNKK